MHIARIILGYNLSSLAKIIPLSPFFSNEKVTISRLLATKLVFRLQSLVFRLQSLVINTPKRLQSLVFRLQSLVFRCHEASNDEASRCRKHLKHLCLKASKARESYPHHVDNQNFACLLFLKTYFHILRISLLGDCTANLRLICSN